MGCVRDTGTIERKREMSKKDFEGLAKIIREHRLEESNFDFLMDLIAMLERSNPFFSRSRFLDACRHEK